MEHVDIKRISESRRFGRVCHVCIANISELYNFHEVTIDRSSPYRAPEPCITSATWRCRKTKPTEAQLSLDVVQPLAERIATASCRCSYTGSWVVVYKACFLSLLQISGWFLVNILCGDGVVKRVNFSVSMIVMSIVTWCPLLGQLFSKQYLYSLTHIGVSKVTISGPYNGLSPGRRQAIIWTNAGILLIRILETNFSEIWSEIHTFLFKKMYLKMSSAKWWQFCLGLNVLKSGHCNSFKDRVLADFVYKYPTFEWISVTW